jgi:hypothetical protein
MAPNCSLFGPFCAQIDFSKGCQILKQNPGFFDGRCITKAPKGGTDAKL